MQVGIRDGAETDYPFIFASWLHNYKDTSYFAKRIKHSIYYEFHHKIIEHILKKPSTHIYVAHSSDDPDHILGYLVMEKLNGEQVLHFTFVKSEFQKLGIAKSIFKAAAVNMDSAYFTHWTYAVNTLSQKYPTLKYNPYGL